MSDNVTNTLICSTDDTTGTTSCTFDLRGTSTTISSGNQLFDNAARVTTSFTSDGWNYTTTTTPLYICENGSLTVTTSVTTTSSSVVAPTDPTLENYGIKYDEISSAYRISSEDICKFKFNHYNGKYEKNIKDSIVHHNLLPSFYTNVYYSNNKERSGDNLDFVIKALTINQAMNVEQNKIVSTPSSTPITQVQEYKIKKYFTDYSKVLLDSIENSQNNQLDYLKNKMSYIFIAPEELKRFNSSQAKKDLFPFYNEIKIPAFSTGPYGKFLNKFKKYDDFKITRIDDFTNGVEEVSVAYGETTVNKRVKRLNPALTDTAYADDNIFGLDYTFFDEGSKIEKKTSNMDYGFIFDHISDLNFELQYSEEFNNIFTPDSHEILYYKISKHKDSSSNPALSTFCVANTGEEVRYIDTQIKINERYVYVVHAMIFVQNEDGDSFLLQEKLVEAENCTLNNPPMVPDFNIVPIMNDDRRVKILFNKTVGSKEMLPISLTEEENTRIQKIKSSQGKLNGDGKIKFSNDDEIKMYEIYRLETPPATVQDFAKARKTRTAGDSCLETLQKNKTYYYMFRAIDSHGNISNPSSVLQVTLVSSGYIYPIIREYSYEDYREKSNQSSRTTKRYIRISPLPSELLVQAHGEYDTAHQVAAATMGVGESYIWNKKYKMRITSKTTGKKIDVNFKFRQQFNNSGEEVV